jgi:hypothetical protein
MKLLRLPIGMLTPSLRMIASALLALALLAQDSEVPRFQATTRLVLVPFSVERRKHVDVDLQPADFVLREDGHPRDFTVFEAPHAHPDPLELILLFDTSTIYVGPGNLVPDLKSAYEFLNEWNDSDALAVLPSGGIDLRISVYHYAGQQLERLCAPTSNPREIAGALRRLFDPIPTGKGTLALLPGSKVFQPPRFNRTAALNRSNGWPPEAIVGAMNEAASSPVVARRILIWFSEGSGNTLALPQVIVGRALPLGITIDPVIVNFYRHAECLSHIFQGCFGVGGVATHASPRFSIPITIPVAQGDFNLTVPIVVDVGTMTGGTLFVPNHLNRAKMIEILEDVRGRAISQYVVGFAPNPSATPRKHKLEVTLVTKSEGSVVGGNRKGVVY